MSLAYFLIVLIVLCIIALLCYSPHKDNVKEFGKSSEGVRENGRVNDLEEKQYDEDESSSLYSEEEEDKENRVLFFGNLTYTNGEADICTCWDCDSGIMAVPVGYKVCPLCGKETIARDYSIGWRKMTLERLKENCEISRIDLVNGFATYVTGGQSNE